MIVNKTGKFRGVKKPDFCRKSVFTARIIECLYIIGRSFIRRINLVKKKNQTRPPAPNKKEGADAHRRYAVLTDARRRYAVWTPCV